MGVSSSQQSLKAIRADLGLPEAGSARERAVMNKVNKTGGNIAFSEYAGNIVGLQHVMDRQPTYTNDNDWKKTRDVCSGHFFLVRNGQAYMSGGVAYCQCTERDAWSGDSGYEYRQLGRVLESGDYELTGKSFATWDQFYRIIEHHNQIVCHSNGWLEGSQTIPFNSVVKGYSQNGDTYNWNSSLTGRITLSTSHPYVTLIGRNIAKAGGDGTQPQFTHNWRNMRLKKI